MTTPYNTGASSIEPERRADAPSLGERLGDVTRDLSTLMRQEVALAKAEVTQSASNAGKGIGMLVGAALAGYFVLLFLSIALWVAIGSQIGYGWSALIVAVIWAIIAAVLVSVGKKELNRVRGVPATTETLGKIPNALKGQEEKNQ
jgi:hypothetical protein